jgi:hypothetical protein
VGLAFSYGRGTPVHLCAGMRVETNHQPSKRDQIDLFHFSMCTGARRKPAVCSTNRDIEQKIFAPPLRAGGTWPPWRDSLLIAKQPASASHMLRIVPHNAPHVGRSNEPFLGGFELHLLNGHHVFPHTPAERTERLFIIHSRYRGSSLIRKRSPP